MLHNVQSWINRYWQVVVSGLVVWSAVLSLLSVAQAQLTPGEALVIDADAGTGGGGACSSARLRTLSGSISNSDPCCVLPSVHSFVPVPTHARGAASRGVSFLVALR